MSYKSNCCNAPPEQQTCSYCGEHASFKDTGAPAMAERIKELEAASLEIYDWMLNFAGKNELEMMCPVESMSVICPGGWKERQAKKDSTNA